MSKEARIRVRLDTKGAQQDQRQLDRGFERSTQKASRMGGAMGLSMKSVMGGALGAMGIGALLSKIAGSASAQGIVGTAYDQFQSAVFGANAGAAQGTLSARDAVANRFAQAAGQGLVDPRLVQQAFDFEQKHGAGAKERGKAQINAMLGGEVRDSIVDMWTKAITELPERMEKAIEKGMVARSPAPGRVR